MSPRRSAQPSLLMQVMAGVTVLFLLAPLVVVIGGSFTTTDYVTFPPHGFTLRWYAALAAKGDFIRSFADSLLLAAACAMVATPLGTLAALALHRDAGRGREWLRSFLLAPLLLPTIVTAVALLQFYQRAGFDQIFLGLLIGHVLVTTPYVVRSVGAGLAGMDPAIVEAAQSLGAAEGRILLRVLLPGLVPALLASVIFVFIISFDETTLSLFLSGPDMMPLPVRIYNYIEFAIDPMVASVSTVLILFAYLLVILLEKLVGLDRAFGGGV